MLLQIWLNFGALCLDPLLDGLKDLIWLLLQNELNQGLYIWIDLIVHISHHLLSLLILIQFKIFEQMLNQALLLLHSPIGIYSKQLLLGSIVIQYRQSLFVKNSNSINKNLGSVIRPSLISMKDSLLHHLFTAV